VPDEQAFPADVSRLPHRRCGPSQHGNLPHSYIMHEYANNQP
jgi:hypothetical protein